MHSKCGASLTTWVLLMFVMWMCTSAMAGFAEIPANVTVELGTETPPSRCHHISGNFITWRVNGSPVAQFSDIRSCSVNESGNIVYTLTIPAEPQYNGTVVECVAVFFDGSLPEVSPPATIFFTLAVSPPETTYFEITQTNTPPDTTSFEVTPSPLTVAVEQGTATFQCQHPLAVAIGWRVNGMPLYMANLSNVSTATPNDVTTLSIATLLAYNGITVECIATFIDASSPQFTAPVVLLIQDTPKQVENASYQKNYSKDELTTLWNPLPTLDINDTDPDILYTVELYQITCGQNILINRTEVAGSNVTEEGLDLMQIYKAVIAARNNVRGARNGPSVEMKEKFMSLNGPTLVNLTRNNLINIQSNVPVPSYYKMTLESLDGREELVINITVERNGEMIDMHVEESVPPNSLWRAAILAYGCESDRTVTNYELSTHDIQNVVVSSQLPGQISVSGELISGATVTGVLVVVYSLTNSNDVHYIAKQREGNGISLNVTGLTGAEYGVSTFALQNRLPLPSVVTTPKNIAVLNGHQDRAPLIEYELATTNSSHVCITCTFLESSATDCVVVVHQRISQLSSSGLMNIESGHKFTRSGDTAYGCIEGVNLEQHQVGVVGDKMITMEPKSKNRESSLAGAIVGILGGIAVAVIVTVAVIVAVVACTRLKRRRKTAAQPVYSEVTSLSDLQPHTIVNIERGSRVAVENDYESAGLSEKPAEEQLLLPPPPLPARVEADGGASPGVSTPHVPDHGTRTSPTADNGADDPTAEEDPPPLPPRLMDDSAPVSDQGTSASPHQVTSDNGAGDPTYATVLARTPNTVQESADSHTHALDNDAGDPPERPAEEHPPLPPRLMDDGASTPHSADQSTPHQVTSDNSDPTYAPVLTTTPNAVSQPAATEKVSYEDIQKYQNEQGQHYPLPQLKVTSKKWPVDDLHQVVYTKLKPHSITQTGDQNIDCTSDRAVTPTIPSHETTTVAVHEPVNTEQLFSFLLPYASKWQSLWLALSFDEDRLDEVFTNNERDEDCLREMLELYMLRSDLDHSWEKVQAALEKIESSTTSVQESNSSQNSSVFSGETIPVPDMDADSDPVDKQPAVGKEESSDSGYSSSQMKSSDSSVVIEMEDYIAPSFGIKAATVTCVPINLDQSCMGFCEIAEGHHEELCKKNPVHCQVEENYDVGQISAKELHVPEANEKNRSMLNPLSENLKTDKQEESSDSGYGCSQQPELESSENSVALEMEDDSTSLSQAALDERLKASEKNGPILFLSDLEEYESRLDPSFGSQTTLTDGGEFGRTMNEELPIPRTINSHSPGLQLERFYEQPEDERNNDKLCKIKPVHCEDSCIHDNYNGALIHQMGLLSDQKTHDKLEYNNTVEESSMVHY